MSNMHITNLDEEKAKQVLVILLGIQRALESPQPPLKGGEADSAAGRKVSDLS